MFAVSVTERNFKIIHLWREKTHLAQVSIQAIFCLVLFE